MLKDVKYSKCVRKIYFNINVSKKNHLLQMRWNSVFYFRKKFRRFTSDSRFYDLWVTHDFMIYEWLTISFRLGRKQNTLLNHVTTKSLRQIFTALVSPTYQQDASVVKICYSHLNHLYDLTSQVRTRVSLPIFRTTAVRKLRRMRKVGFAVVLLPQIK